MFLKFINDTFTTAKTKDKPQGFLVFEDRVVCLQGKYTYTQTHIIKITNIYIN